MLSSLSKRNHLLNCSNFCSKDFLTSRPWIVRMCRRLDCEVAKLLHEKPKHASRDKRGFFSCLVLMP